MFCFDLAGGFSFDDELNDDPPLLYDLFLSLSLLHIPIFFIKLKTYKIIYNYILYIIYIINE